MKKVCMIYTGGTIGMKKTKNGYYPEPHFLERSLKQIHELSYHEVPEFDLIEYSPLLDSSNVQMEQWTKIAEDIFEHYDDYCGFVILHGTDTMAYTASALSFMLQGLSKSLKSVSFLQTNYFAETVVSKSAPMRKVRSPLPTILFWLSQVSPFVISTATSIFQKEQNSSTLLSKNKIFLY